MRNGIGLSIAAMLLLAAPLAAQERSRAVAPRADGSAVRVRAAAGSRSAELAMAERALRLREQLELSDEQVSRLEAMRRDALARWLENALEQEELQSRMRAGYEDEDARGRLRELAEARRDDVMEMRDRVEAVLTEEQREQLNRRSRAVVAPRGGLERAPEARARMRPPRAVPSPAARRAPGPPRAPRVMPAPRPRGVMPAPRPPRVRRWM